METTFLCLVIGHDDGSLTAWNSANDSGLQISVGDKIELLIEGEEEGDSFVAPAEVSYISETEDGSAFAVLFSHEEDTTEEMQAALEASGWDAADEEMLANLEDILNSTSVVARTHWMFLVVGDTQNPEGVRIWKRVLEPEIPDVPFFGERFYTQLFFSDIPEGEFSTVADSATDEQKAAPLLYVDELVNMDDQGDMEKGFPVVVFQVGKVDYGHAQISMYTKSIAPFDEFSLAADGWEAVSKEELDPVKERIPERIDLALRTRIRLRRPDIAVSDDIAIAPESVMEITDYELIDPENVKDDQFELLPGYLIEHVQMQREINELSDSLSDESPEGK